MLLKFCDLKNSLFLVQMYARHILKQAPKAGGWLVKHMLTAADLAERVGRGDMGHMD